LKKIAAIVLACFLVFAITKNTNAQDRYQATWESLSKYKTAEWFRDTTFGIFIRWGVYSVPAFGSLGLPNGKLNIESLSFNSGNGKIATIKMIGSDEKVTWVQKQDALAIDPSKNYPSEYAVSYVITFIH